MLTFMAVTTLVVEKFGAQKIKCNGLLLLDKSHKFQNLYKVNVYSIQNTVLIHILLIPE